MGGHGWGEVNTAALSRAVARAIEAGLIFFDTADIYGLGESEAFLGTQIAGMRSEVFVATKCGVRVSQGKSYYDSSPEWIRAAIEASLRRLNTDYIDLYQLHYWDGVTEWGEIFGLFSRLREEGKIRFAGLSNVIADQLSCVTVPAEIVSVQLQYSLADREYETELCNWIQRHGLSVLSWGSLSQGALSGKYAQGFEFAQNDRRRREVYRNFHGDRAHQIAVIVEFMRAIAEREGKTIANVALRWILDRFPNSAVLVGIKAEDQLEEHLGVFGWTLTKDDVTELEKRSACLLESGRTG